MYKGSDRVRSRKVTHFHELHTTMRIHPSTRILCLGKLEALFTCPSIQPTASSGTGSRKSNERDSRLCASARGTVASWDEKDEQEDWSESTYGYSEH
jgi:hypothetical protein